jgi:TolB-like protein
VADIFISYSKQSQAQAKELAHELQAKGFSVWYDTSLLPGDSFGDVIMSELAQAKAAIVIWDAASIRSEWVRSEASRARARRILIPVRAEGIRSHDIPPPFDSLHTELLANRFAIEAALAKLGIRPTSVTSEKSSSAAMDRGAVTASDKPSIAVLPFQNLSGDPQQEYFADGLAEDIITELSRFREFAVIARNSTFFYKGKPIDVAQVARDLGVRYVLEGSVRNVGNRVRVTAQLIDATTNSHLWAERYDRKDADLFDLQEEITRTVVASIAPQINLAEIARSRRDATDNHARQLAWRARGLLLDALSRGESALMRQAIAVGEATIAADPNFLYGHESLVWAHLLSALYRWGDDPDHALDKAWVAVERMTALKSQDERTLTARGAVRFRRGEQDGALADLRRAHEINPNFALAIITLAHTEASMGLAQEAQKHAHLAMRLSPRDPGIGTAHLALAMAHFSLRDYAEAVRWCESAIQQQHRAPIRRALMVACSARAGDMVRARAEIAVLTGFAPGFIASVFRGENPVFTRREDMEHLLDGLRLAGLSGK